MDSYVGSLYDSCGCSGVGHSEFVVRIVRIPRSLHHRCLQMSRMDKLSYGSGTPSPLQARLGRIHHSGYIMKKCRHKWQPVSFVFESQLLDSEGRVIIRQPLTKGGRVYCVCMKCLSYTYVVTKFVGFYLGEHADLADKPNSTP